MKSHSSFVVLLSLSTISLFCICGNSGSRIGREINRGIPTEDGIYCPAHDKFISSDDDFGPRCYRNQRFGRGRGMGRGRGGMGRGMGRRCRFW